MCFGPVVPNGYGVCYNPMNDHINFAISAFNACEETNAAHLAQAVQHALLDMGTLLEQTPRSKLWRAPQLFTVVYVEEADDTTLVLVTVLPDSVFFIVFEWHMDDWTFHQGQIIELGGFKAKISLFSNHATDHQSAL